MTARGKAARLVCRITAACHLERVCATEGSRSARSGNPPREILHSQERSFSKKPKADPHKNHLNPVIFYMTS
jgi:hypothetical protein